MNRKARTIPIVSKPMIIIAVLIFTLATLLNSCTITPSTPQEVKTPADSPQPGETATPAPTPTATPTQTATPAPFYQVNEPGETFSPAQAAINKSQSAIDQKARIQRWLDYWIKFDNRPFAWESTQLHWKYIYDNNIEPSEVGVLLEAGGEYGGKLFTVPLGNGVLAEFPPEYDGGEIETGFGPLELTSGEEGLWLSVQDGIPVRRDAKGQIDEKLDMVKGVWVKVEKYPIDLEKLSTTPESYEYLLNHKDEFVKGPDPLEVGMEEFFKWYSEKLIPSLGDYKERDGNLCYDQLALGNERLVMSEYALDRSFKGQMEFWYFEHDGVVYPVLEIAGIKDGRIGYNIGVVLVEGFRPGPSVVIKGVKDGQKEFSGLGIFVVNNEMMPVSEDVHKILEQGFFYYNGYEHYFGIGTIGLWPIDY